MKLTVDKTTLYRLWLDRIVKTHLDARWDAPSTEESEAEDDWFHDQWLQLADDQRRRLCGLSADLHSLRDQEKLTAPDGPPRTEQQLASETQQALLHRDWDRVLSLLRVPPRFQPQAVVDYLRGRAWMGSGEPQVALLFFDNAARRDPSNLAYPSLALECLNAIPDWQEALARAERYRASETVPPRLLFRAGEVFRSWALMSDQPSYFEQAVEVVERGFALLDQSAAKESLPSVIAGAYATKALALGHLGRHRAALTAMDQAIARFPDNATLLTLRGLLKQQLQRTDAREDLKAAIEQGTGLVWPYLELARLELEQRNFPEVLELCRQGLARAGNDRIAAEFFQFRGIALFELGESLEEVQQAFDASLELDPLAAETQVNRERFKASSRDGQAAGPWQVPAGSPLEAMQSILQQQHGIAA